MSPECEQQISDQIELAFDLAPSAPAAAASAFGVARDLSVSRCDSAALQRKIFDHATRLTNERETYRAMIADQRSASKGLVVLGDSLGLPRPDSKAGLTAGADHTYPMMVLDHMPGHGVESHCQRYFTTQSVVDLLRSTPQLGAEADVLIHVGLNDCATRMFLESHRLALDLLPPEIKERVVLFAQHHRREILTHLPALHYVDPKNFRANLNACLRMLSERNAHRVLLATIILPPEQFWADTPGINQNFASYNLDIMSAAESGGAEIFDIDRLIWARQGKRVLLDDGMHLSADGHALFAEQAAALFD